VLQSGDDYPEPWYKNSLDIPLHTNANLEWEAGPDAFGNSFVSAAGAADPTNGGNTYTLSTGSGVAGTIVLGCELGGGAGPP